MIGYEELSPDDIVLVYTVHGPYCTRVRRMTFKELESFDDIDKLFKIAGPEHDYVELSQLEGKVKGFDIEKILDNYQTCQEQLLRLCYSMSNEAKAFYDSIFEEKERDFSDDWHYNTIPAIEGYCNMIDLMSGGAIMP